MLKFRAETRPTAETLTPQQAYCRAKQAFEQDAIAFDSLLGIDKAHLNLGNWLLFNPSTPQQAYSFFAEAKLEAASRMSATYYAFCDTFDDLPKRAQEDLATRPTIVFDCLGDNETEPSSFEFNLPKIIVGHESLQSLWGHPGVRSDDMARCYVGAYESAEARAGLLRIHLDEAAKFLTGGKYHPDSTDPRFYECNTDRRLGPGDELSLARIDRMEKLAEVYTRALSNGDRAARAALCYWLKHVNNRILLTTGGPGSASAVFGPRASLWEQRLYPFESALIPIGKSLVVDRNARRMEYERSLWPPV